MTKTPDTYRETIVYALIQNQQILMAKRLKSDDVYFGQYVIPGGKVESVDLESENYLSAALLRETHEELGIIPTRFEYLFSNNYPIIPDVLLHFFVVTKWTGEITNQEPHKESFMWVSLDQVLASTPFISVQEAIRAIRDQSTPESNRQIVIEK